MRPWKTGRASALALLTAMQLLPAAAEPGRAAPDVGEVRLPSVAIGKTYSTWRLSQAPVLVRNDASDTIRVHVSVIVPARHEVRPGVLPLPDRDWVQLVSATLEVPPHSVQRTDVRLTLPYDTELAGHTYQVDLWCAELPAAGRRPAVLQRHRILFKVEMDYRDDTEIDFATRRKPLQARI